MQLADDSTIYTIGTLDMMFPPFDGPYRAFYPPAESRDELWAWLGMCAFVLTIMGLAYWLASAVSS